MTAREPEFTSSETALFLAYQLQKADLGPHGIPMSEAMDPANEHAFTAANGGVPSIDFAEKAIEDAKDAYYDSWPDANRNGHMWGVIRVPKSEPKPD